MPFKVLGLGFLVVLVLVSGAESRCSKGCDLALASYYIWDGANLTFVSEIFQTQIQRILDFNPQVPNQYSIEAYTRLNVPFACNCINGEFLGHQFRYNVRSGDTYYLVANLYYSNLTTVNWLQTFNSYPPEEIPRNAVLNVTVNCSCGDSSVSKHYGLFVTYPLRPGESLSSVAANSGLPSASELIQRYNPNSNFSSGSGLVYIPGRDQSGNFPALKSSKAGISTGAIAGISAAGIAAPIMAVCIYVGIYRRRLLEAMSKENSNQHGHGNGTPVNTTLELSAAITEITVDKSLEFSYEELAQATDDFSLANKIGQGGFGAVYFSELRGEV